MPTRKSSEEGLEQDFNSLHAQREASEAYIKSQKHEGWQLVKTAYDDGGFSGGTMKRPALTMLMQDIEAGRIDVIVVYKVDRLSRSLHDFAKMVEVFDKRGVSFVSVTQQFNTTSSMGRLTLNVLLSFAQFEREVTGERIRDKIAASKKKGMWMGGYAPLGYDIVDRKLVINPTEAEIVRDMYRRYLKLGCVRRLKEDLDRCSIHSKTRKSSLRPGGCSFTRGALYHLLSSPTYIGQIRFKGVCHPGQHAGIIDPPLWDEVQQRMAGKRDGLVKHSRKTDPCPLAGKLFDAASGERLVPVHTLKKGRRYRYYVSQSLTTGVRNHTPNSWRLPGSQLERTVLTIMQSMLKDRHAITNALQAFEFLPQQLSLILDAAHEASIKIGAEPNPNSVMDACIRRVDLRGDSIRITLALTSFVPDQVETALPCMFIITRDTSMQIRRRGQEMRLVVEGGMEPLANIDSTLVSAVARARAWSEALLTGGVRSIMEIAATNQVSDSYVKKIMPLAFLAPEIVESILAGKQPANLTTHRLVRHLDIPLDWQEQRRVLGFSA